MSRSVLWVLSTALLLLMWPLASAQAQQACQVTGTSQTCTNSVAISGVVGIFDTGTLTLNNTSAGTVTGSAVGVFANNADVTNFGTIQSTAAGSIGLGAGITANVTNYGLVQAAGAGSIGVGSFDANVTNFGTIQATGPGGFGIHVLTIATVTNFGTIQANGQNGIGIYTPTVNLINFGTVQANGPGGESIRAITANLTNPGSILATAPGGIGILTDLATNVTNSGTIAGGLYALDLGGGSTLTLLPGSRIVGGIFFGSTGNSLNFLGGNHNLTFNSLAGTTVTGTTPFAVLGNQAAAIDPTPFAMEGRALNDFTREVSAAIPQLAGPAPAAGAPLAFAAPDASARIEDAFASIPGLNAYSGEAMVFKNPTAVYADGTAIWARGFGGERTQPADGVLLHATNSFYGGMLGGDMRLRPDLRLGAFIGLGQTRTAIDFNYGTSKGDLGFGGVYAQYDAGATFLRAAVQAGGSQNSVTRNINNNLAAGGLETANATFNGWYVSPEAAIGHRLALGTFAGASYTLTPSLKVRYLYGSYDGYIETGSTTNLTVGSRAVSTAEERSELKLTRTDTFTPTSVLSTSLYGGVLGTQRARDATINATLLGQAIPFATPGRGNVWGGFGGAGLEWRKANVTLYSAAEYLALSDRSSVVSGRAGLRVGF